MWDSYSHAFPWQVITRVTGLSLSVKLDVEVDVERLRRDAEAVLHHFALRPQHTAHHDGGWTAVGLVAAGGDIREDRGSRTDDGYRATPALKNAPYIEGLLRQLGSSAGRVRLLSLASGESVCWHFDDEDSVDSCFLRIHLPIWTNPKAKLQVSHEDLFWQPGEAWYGEFSFPHRLRNDGPGSRLHLVCDLKVDEAIRRLLPDWYHAQHECRRRWRPLLQRLCRAHQLATFRTARMRKLLGGYDWVQQGRA